MTDQKYYIQSIEFGTPEFDQAIRLRHEILRKPLNMEFTVEQILEEQDMTHLVCYNEHVEMVGCLVLRKLDTQFLKMRQVAVDEPYQKSGIGTLLVEASEQYAKENKFQMMELNARDVAIPFYEKLGYKKIGEAFEEVGIKHFRMEKMM